MNTRHWDRLTAWSALAAVGLAVAALANWGNPQPDDPIRQTIRLYVAHQHQMMRSQFFFVLFGLAVLTFAAGLHAILQRGADEPYVLPTFAVGAAVLNAVWMMLWAAVNGGLALVAGQVSPGEVRLLVGVESAVDVFTGLSFGLVALTAALALRETQVLARWIAWVGVVSGALAIGGDAVILDPTGTGPLGNVGLLGFLGQLLFLVWLLIVGVSLLRRSPAPAGSRGTARRAERVPLSSR